MRTNTTNAGNTGGQLHCTATGGGGRMCTSTNIAGGQPHRSGRMRSSTNNTCSHPQCSSDGGGEDICIIGSTANKPH
jgi:hypothetical protein